MAVSGYASYRSAMPWAAEPQDTTLAASRPAQHPQRISAGPGHREEPRHILLLCLGGIGDCVLSFPALRDLRRARPDDHITALAMWPQSADLLRDLGIFDEVLQHNFQQARWWRSLGAALRLRRRRYDDCILTFPTNRFEYNALAYLLGARRRFGHNYVRGGDIENLRFLLTDRIEQQAGRHVVDENRALVARFTGTLPNGQADTRLGPLAPRYHHEATRMLGHLREPLLGIHAGSSSYKGLALKRWPAERFGELCRRARRQLGLQPVVFGTPEDIELKLQMQAHCPEVFLAHGETIRHTAALIARCAALVSNDSALAHVASALDVPVVMLCGPTDPNEVKPYTSAGRVLNVELGCSPCFRVGRAPMRCTHVVTQGCMKGISVAQVLTAVRECLDIPQVELVRHVGLGLHQSLKTQKGYHLPVLAPAICQGA